MYDSSACLAVR